MSSKKRRPQAAPEEQTPGAMPKVIHFPPKTLQRLDALIKERDAASAAARQAIERINDILETVQEVIPPGYVLIDLATGYIREDLAPPRHNGAEQSSEDLQQQLREEHAAEVAEADAMKEQIQEITEA